MTHHTEAQLSCSVEQVDGRVVVHVRGEIDMATSPRLAEVLAKFPDGTSLRLDLSDVTFLDSSGIAAIVTADENLERRGGDFAISAVSRNAHRTLEICGMNQVLALEGSTITD